jgi:hypothetical protein
MSYGPRSIQETCWKALLKQVVLFVKEELAEIAQEVKPEMFVMDDVDFDG